MTQAKADFAWRTNRGQVRPRNEDSVVVQPDAGVVVIADGIGGASAGDVASSMATKIVSERFVRHLPSVVDSRRAEMLADTSVDEANRSILEYSRQRAGCAGMGTTLVIGYLGNTWLMHTHVGDSRLYRLRARKLEQITRDHSFIQEVVDQGFFPTREEAREYGINENVLTRAVGSSSHVVCSTSVADLEVGDIYLYCTDGLNGMVPHDDMRMILASVTGNLSTAADALVHLAYENGGTDNITLVLVRITALGDELDDSALHTEEVDSDAL